MESSKRVEVLKAFFGDILTEDHFLEKRRTLLRQRAGLTDKDRRKVPKFAFFILNEGKKHISAREVEHEANFPLILEYLGMFAHSLPHPGEVKAALSWCSQYYRLNPWSEPALHEAWAEMEGEVLRAMAAYCMDRFQRYRKSRSGHERMDTIRLVIKEKLKAEGALSPEGKKIPTRGRGASRRKQVEAAVKAKATGMDNVETQPYQFSDSMVPEPSPIRKMPDLSPVGQTDNKPGLKKLDHVGDETSDTESDDESSESESVTSDEAVELISCQPGKYEVIAIGSDEETVLSPEKPYRFPRAPWDDDVSSLDPADQEELWAKNLPWVDPAMTHEEAQSQVYEPVEESEVFQRIEKLADSEDEKKDCRAAGVFKDRTPLCEEVAIPQSLAAQAESQLADLSKDQDKNMLDIHEAEIKKAQLAMRQMQKEAQQDDDPDRALQEQLEEEEERHERKKGRGRGRGRSRGKGRGKGRGRGKHKGDGNDQPEEPTCEKKVPHVVEDTQDCVDLSIDDDGDLEIEAGPVPEQPSGSGSATMKSKKPKLVRKKSKLGRIKKMATPSPMKKVNKPKRTRKSEPPQSQYDIEGSDVAMEHALEEQEREDSSEPRAEHPKPDDEVAQQEPSEPGDLPNDAAEKPKAERMSKRKSPKEPKEPKVPKRSKGEDREAKKDDHDAANAKTTLRDAKWNLLVEIAEHDQCLQLPSKLGDAKSFTLSPPPCCADVSSGAMSSINVVLLGSRSSSSTFQIYKSEGLQQRCNKENEMNGTRFKDMKKGVTVTWSTNGGLKRAWEVAKRLAGWSMQASSHS